MAAAVQPLWVKPQIFIFLLVSAPLKPVEKV